MHIVVDGQFGPGAPVVSMPAAGVTGDYNLWSGGQAFLPRLGVHDLSAASVSGDPAHGEFGRAVAHDAGWTTPSIETAACTISAFFRFLEVRPVLIAGSFTTGRGMSLAVLASGDLVAQCHANVGGAAVNQLRPLLRPTAGTWIHAAVMVDPASGLLTGYARVGDAETVETRDVAAAGGSLSDRLLEPPRPITFGLMGAAPDYPGLAEVVKGGVRPYAASLDELRAEYAQTREWLAAARGLAL